VSTRSKNSDSKPQDPMMYVLAFLAMLVLLVIVFKL